MGCNCADRQKLISKALRDARQGNVKSAGQKMAVVASSTVRDAARLMRSPLASKRR